MANSYVATFSQADYNYIAISRTELSIMNRFAHWVFEWFNQFTSRVFMLFKHSLDNVTN